jgi:hypothetical protein
MTTATFTKTQRQAIHAMDGARGEGVALSQYAESSLCMQARHHAPAPSAASAQEGLVLRSEPPTMTPINGSRCPDPLWNRYLRVLY